MSPIDWFIKGGYFMWPILLWFLVGAAVAIERGIYFFLTAGSGGAGFRGRNAPVTRLRAFAESDDFQTAEADARRNVLRRRAEEIVEEQERRLGVLPVLAATAPLLGLLGTIAGMMQAFRAVEQAGGAADIGVFAGGIWPALLTTAFGLTVAVILHISHGVLNHQVELRIKRLNRAAEGILDQDPANG